LQPFTFGELSELLESRVPRRLSRAEVVRISEISGGNPFYAIELGLAMSDPKSPSALPGSLAELVRARVGHLDDAARELLLGVASLAQPTVDAIAGAVGIGAARAAELLEGAETAGIVEIDGNKIRFTHPLLAHGVYEQAAPAGRRAMHRRLAGVVNEAESRARHLALGATSADPETLGSLDAAATSAHRRGAPRAAAELLDLAINLGGDAPERRIRSAAYHFDSGDVERANTMLEEAIKVSTPGRVRATAASLLATIAMYVDGFGSGAAILERYLPEAAGDPALSVSMLMGLAYMFVNTGRKRQALDRVDEAVAEAERFGDASLLSRALGLRVVLQFMAGDGVDAARLQRAMALDDGDSGVPVPFQPRIQHAVLMAWTGELDIASDELRAIESRRIEAGQESESVFISFHRAMLEIWRGDFDEAKRIANATMDKHEHLDGDVALFSALTINSMLESYAGLADQARESARIALAASQRAEGRELRGWLLANMAFLEVSLGNYEAALSVVQPVIDGLFDDPEYSEIIVASCVSDAVEAMVALGRLDDADRLTELMERNGNRLDRPWMRAVGGRCRGMVLAAQGDITAGGLAAERAVEQHDRIPMPFERARTQLLLGQLLRRQRQKQSAAAALREAVATFERLNTPLWADRARAELSRVTVRSGGAVLSPSERRVAELAASGKTNRVIATELFISPKTVDTNLGRIYRKLGIHSRAELTHWVSENQP
jgi:ATP/maltotriose-dependent transcriptional regulator MalT